MRRLMTIDCAGVPIAATLDDPGVAGAAGLLIVSGGTQTRTGAHRGMARLAEAVAAAGHPVMRFDRRGVGDSGGDDPGFADSGPDIAAAAAALRRECPTLRRVIGFGLCDGATALALHHADAKVDGLILANPWVVEAAAGEPPPAAIRRRYAERLFDPAMWRRALSGRLDYRAALRGLASVARKVEAAPLGRRAAAGLAAGGCPAEIVLATGDATAIAFDAEYRGEAFADVRAGGRATVTRLDTRSHSFATGDDAERLAAICVAALARWADDR